MPLRPRTGGRRSPARPESYEAFRLRNAGRLRDHFARRTGSPERATLLTEATLERAWAARRR